MKNSELICLARNSAGRRASAPAIYGSRNGAELSALLAALSSRTKIFWLLRKAGSALLAALGNRAKIFWLLCRAESG